MPTRIGFQNPVSIRLKNQFLNNKTTLTKKYIYQKTSIVKQSISLKPKIIGLLLCWLCFACGERQDSKVEGDKVFKRLSSKETGITFKNELQEKEGFDIFRYRNFYNGGGVGIADFDNDGLADIYLTSNMGNNQLYHNLGNWKFEEIGEKADIIGTKAWATGVSIADVDADGWLDIYVSNAGDVEGGNRENELFINNHNLTFTERAAEFGLNDKGFSTHAAFFDFDKDGDLDCYVLNNSYRPAASLGYRNLRNERDEFGGHKLYKNDDGHFADISEQAGIFGSVIGFGLGVTVGDINQDGWPDMYISNDLYERDYLYINNQKGGFDEEIEKYMGHISMFSMGADMADLNNDGYPEVFSTDMLPHDDARLKTLISFETYDTYQLRLKNGYYHQFMRNMLHLNTRNGKFIEVGELAGVSSTDWSWGALIADFNNDQHKEIFVSNGIFKDVTNQDFVEYFSTSGQIKAALEGKSVDYKHFVEQMPSNKLSNYLFEQQSNLKYDNRVTQFGLDEPGFSNGAAYGDLDNDDDLDLVVNNVNQELFVYNNQTREQTTNHQLSLTFKGYKKNIFGLGTIVKAFVGNQILAFEHMPIRGFQSSMDYKMIIGLGSITTVDSLTIEWPDQKIEVMKSIKTDQKIIADHVNAKAQPFKSTLQKPLFHLINDQDIKHIENKFNDFDRDRLQYHMLSTQGPAFTFADLNSDGLDDIFIGGSVGTPGKILLQNVSGRFAEIDNRIFDADSLSEDTGAAFFDADGDGDFDLYVATGGSEYTGKSEYFLDRLYLNTGSTSNPVFKKSVAAIPTMYQSGSCVRPADFDKDGDLDLFVGTRHIPGQYGIPCDQFLLVNDGKGMFQDASTQLAPSLKALGMVADASWSDYDGDGLLDLIIVGEWMPVIVLKNTGKKLELVKNVLGLEKSNGWWNVIQGANLDGDQDIDFIVGNNGLNSKFKPTIQSPISLYVNDFDRNGSQEPVFAFIQNGREYPMALRQDMIKQMSSLRKKFVLYKDYADKPLSDIFDKELIDHAIQSKFYQAQTSILLNNGQSGFDLRPLPIEAQVAPVFGIATLDLNGDKHLDIILGGNLYAVKPEAGRYDAMHELVLLGNSEGNVKAVYSKEAGFDLEGEVRHIAVLNGRGKKLVAFVFNNNASKIYSLNFE